MAILRGDLDRKTNVNTYQGIEKTAKRSNDYQEDENTKSKQQSKTQKCFIVIPMGILKSDLKPPQKLIIAYAINKANVQGNPRGIKMSTGELMDITSIKYRKGMQKHVDELIQNGYLEKTLVQSKCQGGFRNLYTLAIDKIENDFNFKMKDYYEF